MGYRHYRYFTEATNGIVGKTPGGQQLIRITHASNETVITGAEASGDKLKVQANDADSTNFNMTGGGSITFDTSWETSFTASGVLKNKFTNGGALHLNETTTPTAITNYGAIYTKNDNNLYFQDGAGTEHTVAMV